MQNCLIQQLIFAASPARIKSILCLLVGVGANLGASAAEIFDSSID